MPEHLLLGRGGTPAVFERCRDVIRSGGVIVYPTDTFYGLGVDPLNPAAVERLFRIKGRSSDQPILLLIDSRSEARQWAAEVPAQAERLMDRFWPGPLTIVLKAASRVPPVLTGGRGTIGLRVPGNELTRSLLAAVGHALTGTSANRSGRAAPRSVQEAAEVVAEADIVLDSGATAGGLPSTIVEVRNDQVVMIREGAVRLSIP